jgi:hypothetical protein
MRKITFLLFLLCTSIFYGQLSNYSFTQTLGTFTPITSTTSVLAAGTDYGSSPLTNIGFDFVFDGVTYTQFSASPNGFIKLGSQAPQSTSTPISSSGVGPAIAFFARDGKTNGAVVYEVSGTAPGRVLTIEYPNYYVHWSSTSNQLSVQIKLYESTNAVQIVYGASAIANSYFGQVGIVGTSTSNYFNRTTTTDWSNSVTGTSNTDKVTWSTSVGPADGLTYTWNQPNCLPPSDLAISGIQTYEAIMSWTASTSNPSNDYDIYWSTSNTPPTSATAPSDINQISPFDAIGFNSGTTYYWWVRASCGGGDSSAWASGGSFTTACNASVAPSSVENFDTFNGIAPSPNCWSEATGVLETNSILSNVDSQWKLKTNGFANSSASNKGVSINLYSNKKDWFISNPIDLGTTQGAYQLRYKYAVTSYNGTATQSTLGTHSVKVVVSTDGGTTWSDANVIKTYTGAGTYSNTGVDEIIPLTAYSGVVKIAFVATTNTTATDVDFHIDDFVIETNTLSLGTLSTNNAFAFAKDRGIVINTGEVLMTDVFVYDIQGRLLVSKSLVNASDLWIQDISATNQIVLVEIFTEAGKITKKVKL